ncbi:MAG: NFACT family protein [Candidatus Aenigmatarchaeota archaeon]|nr:MAG: NFACT family protein [Candidatus Aenigmarchaeota archaeon]
MNAELKSFDFRFMVKELRASVLGGKFRKVYQYGPGQKSFLFDVYVSTKGNFWLYSDPQKMFLAHHKKEAPETPPNFCMFLRKHLIGSTIKDVRQHGFDRIVEIATDKSIIIFEFIPPGNVILCDRFYNIIMPLQVQRWKDREILPKKPYRYPPENVNPYNISLESFRKIVSTREEKTGSVIAKLGFGSTYANEICSMANVNPDSESGRQSREDISKLFEAMKSLGNAKGQPVTYEDGTVFPFPLRTKKESIKSKWSSLSAPLDEMFSRHAAEEAQKERTAVVEEKKGEIERIIERQKAAVERMKERRSHDKDKADTIYRFYGLVEDILNGIRMARDSGLGWEEIKRRVQSEQTPEADSIVEIKEHEGVVVVELGGKQIELDFTKSVEENAADYYEDSKDARRKAEGAESAMAGKIGEMGMIAALPTAEQSVIKEKKPRKPRKKWYERFKWFVSSRKFLIVAGKDATTNENLIKKKTDDSDWVLHTDIQGSAFVVIKTKSPRGTKFAGLKEGEILSPDVLKEASEIAAACSQAWSRGLGNIDVYAVRPNQVSKTPPSGMSLPRGSFMIYGSRQWFRDVEVKMAIGALVDRGMQKAEAIAGPVMALRTFSKYFVTIKPGDVPLQQLANEIKKKLSYKATPEDRPLIDQINTDDFQRLIPSSSGMLVG